MKKYIAFLIILSTLFVSSCGTIKKPLFQSHSGDVDYSILWIDSIGFIFFVIPGVVALTVDHITGTLYIKDPIEEDYSPIKDERINSKVIRELLHNDNDLQDLNLSDDQKKFILENINSLG